MVSLTLVQKEMYIVPTRMVMDQKYLGSIAYQQNLVDHRGDVHIITKDGADDSGMHEPSQEETCSHRMVPLIFMRINDCAIAQ